MQRSMWFQVNFVKYIVLLLLSSGALILLTDSGQYRAANMQREQQAANRLGWTNIALGAGTAAYWLYLVFRA